MSRFDYVQYDEESRDDQETAKVLVTNIEQFIEFDFKDSRSKALALTKLEECYMWIGKMIRDKQLERSNS
jgi:hypothetical protein